MCVCGGDPLFAEELAMRLPACLVLAWSCPLLCACVVRAPHPTTAAPTTSGGQLAIDPSRPPYRPTLPPALTRAGYVVAGIFEVCAGADGSVQTVSVVKSADVRVDADWMRTLKTWRYQPFEVSGTKLPLCREVHLDVRSNS
jgi:hypothetical protein